MYFSSDGEDNKEPEKKEDEPEIDKEADINTKAKEYLKMQKTSEGLSHDQPEVEHLLMIFSP